MAEYKLCAALAGVYPGNKEIHYGYLCEVREDGIWVELDEVTAKSWISARRVHGPLREDVKPTKKVEPVVEVVKEPEVKPEEVDKTATEVIEEGTGKRPGRPKKAE